MRTSTAISRLNVGVSTVLLLAVGHLINGLADTKRDLSQMELRVHYLETEAHTHPDKMWKTEHVE